MLSCNDVHSSSVLLLYISFPVYHHFRYEVTHLLLPSLLHIFSLGFISQTGDDVCFLVATMAVVEEFLSLVYEASSIHYLYRQTERQVGVKRGLH